MAPRHSNENGSAIPLGDSSATSEIVEQARGRSDGFEMGGDRAIVSTPNWDSQTSVELYKAATTNNEPGTAASIGHAWAGHGDELSQISNELYTAISELGNVWIGQGAAAAQGALVGIANSSSQASEAAQTMAKRLAQQAAAAEQVKKMPIPKGYDPATGMTTALVAGPAALTTDQKIAADAANDVKAQQVAFFNAYTKAMSDIDGSTPSFGPESLGMKPIAGGGGPAGFNRVGTVGGSQGVGSDSVSNGSGYNGSGYAGAGLGPDSGHFTQAGYNPAASHQGAVPGGGSVAPGAGAAPGVGSGVGAGAVPPAPPSGGGGGSHVGQALGLGALGAAGLGIAGARTLGQGNRSGGKSEDSTAAAANEGSGQSAASVGGPQQGLVSAGGTIGGSPTPPPPMSGMGGMGSAGAQQQDDEEHTHASFLIDPDPDETFGANEATPPPVIGAWSEDER